MNSFQAKQNKKFIERRDPAKTNFNGILHLMVVLATVCGNFVILNDICNLSMEVLLEIPDKEKLILNPPPMKLNNIQSADDMEIANLFVDIFLSVYVHNNATNANLNRKNRYACNDNINYNLLDTYTVNRNMLLVVDKFKAVFKGVPSCVPSKLHCETMKELQEEEDHINEL
ncbi:hypothetical protein GQX74_015252 [Glossina fuscipes]|nr:hypothetical protein GQX74_015252 [Glossina fuscipes]